MAINTNPHRTVTCDHRDTPLAWPRSPGTGAVSIQCRYNSINGDSVRIEPTPSYNPASMQRQSSGINTNDCSDPVWNAECTASHRKVSKSANG